MTKVDALHLEKQILESCFSAFTQECLDLRPALFHQLIRALAGTGLPPAKMGRSFSDGSAHL